MHTTATITQPGLYRGLPFAEYARIPAINGSAMERGRRSPSHLLNALLSGSSGDTEDLDMGKALHALVFEPEVFDTLVSVGPTNPKTQEPYGHTSKAFGAWRAENPDAIVLDTDARDLVRRMADKLLAHPAAAEVLTRPGEREVSCVWVHHAAAAPVLCKGRIDLYSPGVALVDLKSTRSAHPDDFARECEQRGYFRKAALYVDGWAAITGERMPFVFVAAEKEGACEPAVYALNDRFLEIGRMQVREQLAKYAQSSRERVWPGYGDQVMELFAPAWLERQYEYMRSDP